MPKNVISIIIFPGSNCDRDLAVAIEKCMGIKPEYIWHNTSHMKKSDMIFLPGGFSFGDYLRAGTIATKSPAIKELIRLSKKGVPVIGICNGFQILTECNLLQGALIKNSNQVFKCDDIYLKVENDGNKSVLKDNLKVLKGDLAMYITSDEEVIRLMDKIGYLEVVVKYIDGVIKSIDNRGWDIKNAIEWKKFEAGMM